MVRFFYSTIFLIFNPLSHVLGLNQMIEKNLLPNDDPRYGAITLRMGQAKKKKLRTMFNLFNRSYNYTLCHVPTGFR